MKKVVSEKMIALTRKKNDLQNGMMMRREGVEIKRYSERGRQIERLF